MVSSLKFLTAFPSPCPSCLRFFVFAQRTQKRPLRAIRCSMGPEGPAAGLRDKGWGLRAGLPLPVCCAHERSKSPSPGLGVGAPGLGRGRRGKARERNPDAKMLCLPRRAPSAPPSSSPQISVRPDAPPPPPHRGLVLSPQRPWESRSSATSWTPSCFSTASSSPCSTVDSRWGGVA